jgi:hypothetical protein
MHNTKHPMRRNTGLWLQNSDTDSEDSNTMPRSGRMLTCHSWSKWQVWKGFCTASFHLLNVFWVIPIFNRSQS